MRKFVFLSVVVGILLCLLGCAKISDFDEYSFFTDLQVETSVSTEGLYSVTGTVTSETTPVITTTTVTAFDMAYVPEYDGTPYCEINNSLPFFKMQDITTISYEYYSPLDELGRCGVCEACIGPELMPTEKRGSIGMVKPSGWQLVRYDGIVDGNYLFNRCHLIGYLLTGQNANSSNLITGTRYMNNNGMLPFETLTADYIQSTGNHVLYRVTPIFEGDNLLATGVLMEALSIEDQGAGVRFNVFCYNVQPQISIDYSTGKSCLLVESVSDSEVDCIFTFPEESVSEETEIVDWKIPPDDKEMKEDFILNKKSKRFHTTDCTSVADIKMENMQEYSGSREALIHEGYTPCQKCNP